jgi:hypothetical protein
MAEDDDRLMEACFGYHNSSTVGLEGAGDDSELIIRG